MASTAGRTKYPTTMYGDPMSGPEQLTAMGDHFDKLTGETCQAKADLPTATAWQGRTVWVHDEFTLYTFSEAGGDWIPIGPNESIVGLVNAGGAISSGWTPGTGVETPRIVRRGLTRTLYGSLLRANSTASWTTILTVPSIDAPLTADGRYIGQAVYAVTTSQLVTILASMNGSGVLGNFGASTSLPSTTGMRVRLDGLSWYRD